MVRDNMVQFIKPKDGYFGEDFPFAWDTVLENDVVNRYSICGDKEKVVWRRCAKDISNFSFRDESQIR